MYEGSTIASILLENFWFINNQVIVLNDIFIALNLAITLSFVQYLESVQDRLRH